MPTRVTFGMRRLATCLACFALFHMAMPALANHAAVEAVLDRTSIPPGGSATLAVVYKIDPGWHTYWINPGDAGAAPKVKWTLPPGVTVSDLRFPIPQRKVTDDLTTFIYENEVALLATVTVAADQKSDVDLTGKMKSVVCSDECILEEQSVALRIPVGQGVPANTDQFSKWQTPQPKRESPLRMVSAEIDSNGKAGRLIVNVPAGFQAVDLIPPKTRALKFEKPTTATADGSSASISSRFETLSELSPTWSGTGLLVLRDAAGQISGEEIQFVFNASRP